MANLTTEIIALADYVSLSKENKLTIAGIFDRFFVEKIPTRWPKMFFVAVLKGKPETNYQIQVRVDSETKRAILAQEFPVKTGNNGMANLITGLENFPLDSFGEYTVTLFEGEDKVGTLSFLVVKRAQKGEETLTKLPN